MITIKKLDLKNASSTEIKSLGNAYKNVFSNDPSWNEYWKCPMCDSAFSKNHSILECHYCKEEGYSVPLVEYWTETTILSDFYKEMKKDRSVCVVAVNEKKDVIGFCWGYFEKVDSNLEKYLDAEGLLKSLATQNIFDEYVAYQDEIAVVPEYQGRGIAKRLFLERHQHFYKENPNAISIFRTLSQPPSVTYKWMIEKLGYSVIHEIESQNRLRVIAGKRLADFF